MEAFRQRQMVCRTTLAPTVGKEQNERTLRAFHAPARGYERGDGNSGRRRTSGLVKQQAPPVTYFNPLQRIQRMSSDTLTDADAERMVYPFHASAVTTPFEQVIVALIDRLEGTVDDVVWNKPVTHTEWSTNLRFFGAWWLVVRSRDTAESVPAPADQHPSGRRSRVSWVQGMHGEPLLSTSTATLLKAFHEDREDQRYTPLLRPGASAAEENQLVADLARRLTGPIDHLDIFHISGLALSAERLHVLFFSGFLTLAAMHDTRKGTRRLGVQSSSSTLGKVSTAGVGGAAAAVAAGASETLSTLSLSSCQITSAGLLIVLTGVAALATYGMNGISTLDLSYNGLQTPSLYAFTQMLRFTFVKRLSLRGNVLASVNIIPFREFLLEGCDRQVEELDLSYTELTVEQVSVLIEALPRLTRLRVLLLEEVTIPFSKLPSLVRAVERTRLWHLRLASTTGALLPVPGTAAPAFSSAATTASASTAAAVASYMKAIEEVCARNARCDVEAHGSGVASASHGGFFGMNTSSFFEAFFRLSELKRSGLGGDASALPNGYGAFTGNDPSLR